MNMTSAAAPQGQQHNAANLQEVLDSAANADQTGKQQFFTPEHIASELFEPFVFDRLTCLDLHMGSGALLSASKAKCPLGVDIDPRMARKPDLAGGEWHTCNADTTLLYSLLTDIGFKADIIALNPPFSQQQYTERLEPMGQSTCPAVRTAYESISKKETADSTLVAAMMLLDLLTDRGDGFLICNHSTAVRLFGEPLASLRTAAAAPGAALRSNLWLWLKIPTGVFANIQHDFETAVLYFARAHSNGHTPPLFLEAAAPTAPAIRATLAHVSSQVYHYRHGAQLYSKADFDQTTVSKFNAAKAEYARIHRPAEKPRFNLWLENGRIHRHLTPFQNYSRKLPKAEVIALNDLHDRTPMELVVQRSTRKHLQEAVRRPFWIVDPALIAAVDAAVVSYQANRAPFYPLPPILRLGFLDEADEIQCSKDFGPFKSGTFYPIQCTTGQTERDGERINILGDTEKVTYFGQELIITVLAPFEPNGDRGRSHAFTTDPEITEGISKAEKHTMAELLEHFVIPDVPDVALTQPEAYAENLRRIQAIEDRVNGGKESAAPTPVRAADYLLEATPRTITPKARAQEFHAMNYQREDLARFTIHDGGILAWEPGLGKTAGMGLCSLIWGANRTLIVAPDSLHQQIVDDLFNLLGIVIQKLDSQEAYYADATLQQANRDLLNTGKSEVKGWWITSYTQLGFNGADEFEGKKNADGDLIITDRTMKMRTVLPHYSEAADLHVGTVKNGIRCLVRPSLATLVRDLFDCVEVDEGVRLKSDDSYVSMGVRMLRPKYRAVMTGTPIKNRLGDIFWLCWWAAGGHDEASARWPYSNENESKAEFENQHMLIERNHTREAKALAATGVSRRFEKKTAAITNIHRLWKLLSNVIVRRRKCDIGQDIVPKTIVPITVPMGRAQKEVYQFHVENPPEFTKEGEEMNCVAAVVTQLQNLRQAALCPDSQNLGTDHLSLYRIRTALTKAVKPQSDAKATRKAVCVALKGVSTPFSGEAEECLRIVSQMIENKRAVNLEEVFAVAPHWREKIEAAIIKPSEGKPIPARSWTDLNPKQQAILLKVEELLSQGEQAVIMSPFQHFSHTLYSRLQSAGVKVVLLDGNTSPAKRGQYSKAFKRREYSVLIGGIQSMGEGHSWDQCANLFLPSLDWAFDKNRQAEDRVHRLTSKKPVNIFTFVTEGSIDARLYSIYREKGDSSSLALDGSLLADHSEELSLGQLLNEALASFAQDDDSKTVDELTLEKEWDRLKARLRVSQTRFNEWHPPIDRTPSARCTPAEVKRAVIAAGIVPVVTIVKGVPDATFGALAGTKDPRIIAAIRAEFTQFCSEGSFSDWRAAWKAYDIHRTAGPKSAPFALPASAQRSSALLAALTALRKV